MEILFELLATDGERLVLSWLLPYRGSRDQQACGPWLLSTQVSRGGQGSCDVICPGPHGSRINCERMRLSGSLPW